MTSEQYGLKRIRIIQKEKKELLNPDCSTSERLELRLGYDSIQRPALGLLIVIKSKRVS